MSCNRKKGGRTPAEAGMPDARSEAARLGSIDSIRITFSVHNAPESWRDYLYWNVELDADDDSS